MFVSPRLLVMLALLPIAGPIAASAQVPANTCGEVLKEDAVLTGDLDCTGFVAALTIATARLDLAGFAVTGAPVTCVGSCVVVGPGTIAGVTDDSAQSESYPASIEVDSATVNGNVGWAKRTTITASTVHGRVSGRRATVSSSTVSDSTSEGILAAKVSVTDSVVRNNARQGIACYGRAYVEGSDVSDNGLAGILCNVRKSGNVAVNFRDVGQIEILDSTVDRNGFTGTPLVNTDTSDGIFCARRASVTRTSVRDNKDLGIHVRGERASGANSGQFGAFGAASLVDAVVSGNDGGAYVETQASALGTSVTGNLRFGVRAGRQMLLDASDVVGNSADPACGTSFTCPDVITTERAPVLRNGASCGTSLHSPGSETWGVCTLD